MREKRGKVHSVTKGMNSDDDPDDDKNMQLMSQYPRS